MGKIIDMETRQIIAAGKRINGVSEVTYLNNDELQRVEEAEAIVPAVFYGIRRALRRVYGDDGARDSSVSGGQHRGETTAALHQS